MRPTRPTRSTGERASERANAAKVARRTSAGQSSEKRRPNLWALRVGCNFFESLARSLPVGFELLSNAKEQLSLTHQARPRSRYTVRLCPRVQLDWPGRARIATARLRDPMRAHSNEPNLAKPTRASTRSGSKRDKKNPPQKDIKRIGESQTHGHTHIRRQLNVEAEGEQKFHYKIGLR